jgi:hypothetical protein
VEVFYYLFRPIILNSFLKLTGNTFPKGLLLILLLVILFIIGTAVWIFFQCRRHYPERDAYGAIASSKYLLLYTHNLF